MEVEFAVFAANATVYKEGVIDILRAGIRGIGVKKFPGGADAYLAYGLILDAEECGKEHTLEVQCWDSDGTLAAEPYTSMFRISNVTPGQQGSMVSAASLGKVLFPKPDEYEIRLYIDGNLVINKPFIIIAAQNPPEARLQGFQPLP